jgi:hypothetical protein
MKPSAPSSMDRASGSGPEGCGFDSCGAGHRHVAQSKPCPQLTAAQVAAEYGYTAKHWGRLAAAGRIPGASQPLGAGGQWFSTRKRSARWWQTASERFSMAGLYRRGQVYWARATREVETSGEASKHQIDRLLTSVLGMAQRARRDRLGRQAAADVHRSCGKIHSRAPDHHQAVSGDPVRRQPQTLGEHYAGKMVHQITSETLSDFETKRRTQGVAAGTIRRDLACLSSMLTSCIDWEWIDEQPRPRLSAAARQARAQGSTAAYPLPDARPRNPPCSSTPSPTCATPSYWRSTPGCGRTSCSGWTWLQIDHVRGIITTTTRTKSGRARMVPLPERSRTIVGTLPRYLDCPYVLVNPETGRGTSR